MNCKCIIWHWAWGWSWYLTWEYVLVLSNRWWKREKQKEDNQLYKFLRKKYISSKWIYVEFLLLRFVAIETKIKIHDYLLVTMCLWISNFATVFRLFTEFILFTTEIYVKRSEHWGMNGSYSYFIYLHTCDIQNTTKWLLHHDLGFYDEQEVSYK